MAQYQTRSNVNTRDKVRPGTAFDDERNATNTGRHNVLNNNISSINTFYQPPIVTTTITTKHYNTDAELQPNLSKLDRLRKEEYHKLVEKHQQELLKRKEQQQRQQHLKRQQLHELGFQMKRNQVDQDQEKHHFGVRLTGIYPPEYFDNHSDDEEDEEDEEDEDEIEYYLPPPPEEFNSSVNSTHIKAIPPPEHYNHSPLITNSPFNSDFRPSGALKKDTNLKLFVTTATFSPAKSLGNNTKMNPDDVQLKTKDGSFFIREPTKTLTSGNDLSQNNKVVARESSTKSDMNQINQTASNSIVTESLRTDKQTGYECKIDNAPNLKPNLVSSKQLEAKPKADASVEKIGFQGVRNGPESSHPPILIRRHADKKGFAYRNNATQVESMKNKTEQDVEPNLKMEFEHSKQITNASIQEKQSNEAEIYRQEENKEKCEEKTNSSEKPQLRNTVHEISMNNRRSIEIRTEPTSDSSLKKSNSIKYKMDAKPPNLIKSDKPSTPQRFRLPTPELKIQYVSKSPRTSCSDAPSESPNEKSTSKSFFTNLWNSKRNFSTEDKQNSEDKKLSSNKLSNTQKFLNLLNVKNSPTLPFKLQRNKDEAKSKSEGRKVRKKSLDLLGDEKRKLPMHHSTPPLKVRGHSESDPEEVKTFVSMDTVSQKKGGKQTSELMAVETDSNGVPTKHIILTPSSKDLHSNWSRTNSPTLRHSRQNSDGSAVFTTDLVTFSNKSEHSTKPSQHFVIVAIDFGTTFSGYAFCFVRDPDSLHIMRRWEGGDPGLVNQKTLTTLLLDPDGKFHSFGFSARDAYHDLDEEQARKWFYFEKFKMTLHHNAELNKDTAIRASNGKPFPALKVFSHALKYFKDHALQELTDQSETNIYNEDIRWVITVPAIWKAPAKQFMRQAAYQAGIAKPDNPSQLMIALEPEAASIYVRKLRIYQLVPESSSLLSTSTCSADTTPRRKGHNSNGGVSKGNFFKDVKYQTLPTSSNKDKECLSPSTTTVGQEVDVDGTRYMVVDCGGGTVDITVHEMEANGGSLRELHKATGGPYGSIGIDHEFEKLLVRIFGPEFMDSFKLKRQSGWIDLMTAFESRKRSAHPDKQNSLNIALPFSFIEFYKKNKGSSVESAIKKFGNREVTWSSQGMLRLTPGAMQKLFQPTLDKIKQAVGDVLNYPNAKGIKYLFLVGGFAESGLLQNEIRREFGQLMKIVIPQDVGTTILKGAVCFGLDPTVVSERICRMTYGVGVLNKFIDGVHPPSKLVVKDGVRWCIDVLDKFVMADQPVALGDTVVRSYAPARAGQRSSVIHIYCSENADAMFVTDPGVKRCGTLCLDSNEGLYRHVSSGKPVIKSRRSREIQARMTFGDTEIKMSAVDVATGKCVRSTIDFLGG